MATQGIERMSIDKDGVRIKNLTTQGFVRNDDTGLLSTSPLVNGDLPVDLTGKTINGITNTSLPVGFSVEGGLVSKKLTIGSTMTILADEDDSTLDIGKGGSLVASAFKDTTNASNIRTGTLSDLRLPIALRNHSYNDVDINAFSVGFGLLGGTITQKQLTVLNDIIISGIDGSTVATLDPLTGKLYPSQLPAITSLVTSVAGRNGDVLLTFVDIGGTISNSQTTATSINNPFTIVLRDGSGTFDGTASGNVSKSGDTMTGQLNITSLRFVGSLTTGLSALVNVLSLITNGIIRVSINASGTVQITGLNVVGVMKTDVSGNVSTSLIVNADIASGASISDTKLATITSAGKVSNSATTATSLNTASAIVSRDSSGDCVVRNITANNFFGNATSATTASSATSAITASSATNFTGTLIGDVTGTQSANVVSSVGGQSASNIASAVASVLSATSNDTASTIVVRSGLGKFATNMITIDGTPTNPNDVATKAYVDTASSTGINPIGNCIVVSVIQTALSGLQTIDSVLLVDSNRVLLVNQALPVENGVWLAHAGGWTRPLDFNTGGLGDRSYILITSGFTNGGSSWMCNTPAAVIDTDPLGFIQFSLPGSETGNNVGAGTGMVFRDKTGNQLNFKTILAGTHLTATNNANDITLTTDATSSNVINTIASRDGTGTISANLTGTASGNVNKTGDNMTGALVMLNQNAIQYGDTGVNYVGFQAPSVIGASYTMKWPTGAPSVNQKLIVDPSDSTQFTWTTGEAGSNPAIGEVISVSKVGNDTSGNGSSDFPFLTLSKALTIANSLSTTSNPISIRLSPGTYVEDNSLGALSLTANGISIVGDSPLAVIIQPNTLSNALLNVIASSWFVNIQFNAGGVSSADGITVSGASAQVIFSNVYISRFSVGIRVTAVLIFILNSSFFTLNSTSIYMNNVPASVNNCLIQGNGTSTGLYTTGSSAAITLNGSVFTGHSIGASINSNSVIAMNGTIFKANATGSYVNGGRMNAVSIEFVLNNSVGNVINIFATGIGSVVRCTSVLFVNPTTPVNNQIAIKVTNQAQVTCAGGEIENYTTALLVGDVGDTSATKLTFKALTTVNCTNDIIQNGTTTLFIQTTNISSSKITINDSTNINFSYFDVDDGDALSIGSFTNIDIQLLMAEIGQGTQNPHVMYWSSLYGTQSIGYHNESSNRAFLSSVGSNDNGIVATTTDRTKQSSLYLFSDTGVSVGSFTALRGWTIAKKQTSSELFFNYQNSDLIGQISVPDFTILQLDGLNNQVQFPNTSTQIVLGSDVNLYRGSANVLQTDDTLQVIAGTTALPSLRFAGSTTSGLSCISSILSFSTAGLQRMSISATGVIQIDNLNSTGVIHTDTSGNLTTSSIIDADISGTISVAHGGTGLSSYTIGDIITATGTTTLASLADVAVNNALISGGVGVAPSYGKIGLATHVSGNLPVTNLNSGTGATSSTFWRGDGTWVNPSFTDYIFAYDTTTQNVSVANTFQDITYNNNGEISGWSHSAGTASFVCGATGKYSIDVYNNFNATGGAAFSIESILVKNGSEVPGSQMYADLNNNNRINSCSKSIIVACNATDTIKVQFTAMDIRGQIKVPPTSGHTSQAGTKISASINITRIA